MAWMTHSSRIGRPDMPIKLFATGILFASIFFAGYCLNLVFTIPDRGLIGAASNLYQLILLASIALFLLSAFIAKLNWIQPAVFLSLSPVAIISDAQGIYGLGFFIMGIFLLERTGFFIKKRGIKVFVLAAFLLIVEIVAVIRTSRPLFDAAAPTFFIIAFGLFLWFLYKDRLVVFLSEPKPKLSLAKKGISPAERTFVLETLKGKSQKEIAVDFDLSESTIRNTLARSYKKLGVEDRVGLAVLGERFEVVE